MTKTQEQITQQALALPADVRAELAEKLWASLEGAEQAEIDKAWAEEADRRMKAIEAGEMEVVDGSEIRKLLRESQK
jgi:putative addiction module component (TIGR02574 family)